MDRTSRPSAARGRTKIVSTLLRLEPFGPFEDPDDAPGRRWCDDPAPPWTLRRAWQNSLGIYLFGLVFMIFGVLSPFNTPGLGLTKIIIVECLIAVLALLYAGAAWVSDASLHIRWIYLAIFAAVMFSTALVLRSSFATFGAYLAVLMATLIPWRVSRVMIGAWGLGLGLFGLLAENWLPSLIGVIAMGIGWAVGAGIEQSRVAEKLRRTELRASELAVVAERERIARDLHDILGHSLTAVSIKSGLAAKLVDADPAAARAEMAEVERIARQALGDVRATASGMREVRLATEIASARSVLESAGISAQTPTAVDPSSDAANELLGYVVREAVTNVVRHSRASRCVITAGPDWVSISDDGRGIDARGGQPTGHVAAGSGSGLIGLRQRVEAGGGRLEITSGFLGEESSSARGTTIRADLSPVAAPEATTSPVSPSVARVVRGMPEILT